MEITKQIALAKLRLALAIVGAVAAVALAVSAVVVGPGILDRLLGDSATEQIDELESQLGEYHRENRELIREVIGAVTDLTVTNARALRLAGDATGTADDLIDEGGELQDGVGDLVQWYIDQYGSSPFDDAGPGATDQGP